MKEFFEKMISQKRKVEMMKEEYQRIKQSLDISGINYENNGGSSGSRKADAMFPFSSNNSSPICISPIVVNPYGVGIGVCNASCLPFFLGISMYAVLNCR